MQLVNHSIIQTTVKSGIYSCWHIAKSQTFDSNKNGVSQNSCKNLTVHNSFENIDSYFSHNHLINGTGGWNACVHSNHNLSKGMVSAQKHKRSLRSLIFLEVAA